MALMNLNAPLLQRHVFYSPFIQEELWFVKSCSQSVSFSELFNGFQELSAYLNSPSFNVLDANE